MPKPSMFGIITRFGAHARLNLCWPFLACTLVSAVGFAQIETAANERVRMERVEELSEDLANDLLELSAAMREGDADRIGAHFAESLTAEPVACVPLEPTPKLKWIYERAWASFTDDGLTQESREISNAMFRQRWLHLLAAFRSIDDVRFKVKECDFRIQCTARARIAFYVIGRNTLKQREWLRGSAWITAKKDGARWRWTSYQHLSIDSLLATEDLFTDVASGTGVSVELPNYEGDFRWYGAAAADLNKDGFHDLVCTTGGANCVYLNDGKGRFTEATGQVGLSGMATGLAPLLFDYDHDGDTDIFLSNIGYQVLYRNRLVPEGRLRFEDVSFIAGVEHTAAGYSACAADVNNDGWEDIYVCSYNYPTSGLPDSWSSATDGTPNLLFLNKGDGTFLECARAWGVDDKRWSFAAQFMDIDHDGRIDLYVANDFGEKALFMNRGNKFADEALARGVSDLGNGMGVSFGDFDNDGYFDIHATNMSSTAGNRIIGRVFVGAAAGDNVLKKLAAGNSLLRNKGDGTFTDITAAIGGLAGGWAWGGGFLDFDNDGWSDLFSPNGYISGHFLKDT